MKQNVSEGSPLDRLDATDRECMELIHKQYTRWLECDVKYLRAQEAIKVSQPAESDLEQVMKLDYFSAFYMTDSELAEQKEVILYTHGNFLRTVLEYFEKERRVKVTEFGQFPQFDGDSAETGVLYQPIDLEMVITQVLAMMDASTPR